MSWFGLQFAKCCVLWTCWLPASSHFLRRTVRRQPNLVLRAHFTPRSRPAPLFLLATACSKSREWVHWFRPPLYLLLGTARLSRKDVSLPPGWDWYHGNGQPEAKPNCWASASGETPICARCSSMEHAPRVTGQTRRLQSGEVDERIGNQSRAQCGDRRNGQQAGQDQLGSFSDGQRLSTPAQRARVFQLDEVGSEILFLGVCRR